MEEAQARLFDLIESKSFEALSNEEKSFVLEHVSEEEYNLHRRITEASSELHYETEEPLPLILPKEKKLFLTRSIPLYQALVGAACLLLAFSVLWPKKGQPLALNFAEHPFTISFDPSASFSAQTIRDTVIQYVPLVQRTEEIIHDTITIVQEVFRERDEAPRMLEAGTMVYPSLNKTLLESNSLCLKDDSEKGLTPKPISFSKR